MSLQLPKLPGASPHPIRHSAKITPRERAQAALQKVGLHPSAPTSSLFDTRVTAPRGCCILLWRIGSAWHSLLLFRGNHSNGPVRTSFGRSNCNCIQGSTISANASTTVAERLECLPPTKTNRVQPPAGSLRIFASESYWMTSLLGRFSRGYLVFPSPCIPALLHSHIISPSSALKTSLSLDEGMSDGRRSILAQTRNRNLVGWQLSTRPVKMRER
ncbi:hypothetical protein PR048_030020 [Dryococelus australis]|uniref:Uncharacterized protein n=1 Tax=Dryococelus australis TaxID=614101 RepID=A0ABQ9G7S9_9NEOP|nr:hypothetical protein PR048_030020 [Dryococelus australis]